MISIQVKQLTKQFGSIVALNGLDLMINPGELFFLLGPSGCGKTTLLRTIAGFYIPEKGQVLFGNDDVTRLEPHKRNTGMMFQSYALWPHMTVAENVAFGLEERKVAADEIKKRVGEALHRVRRERECHPLGRQQLHVLRGQRGLRLGEDAHEIVLAQRAQLDTDREAALHLRDQVGRLRQVERAAGDEQDVVGLHRAVLGADGGTLDQR